MSNPNNRMFEEFLRFVDKIAPTWFVFENVYGLTKFKNGEENIQNHIENRFRHIGYTVKSKYCMPLILACRSAGTGCLLSGIEMG